MARRRIAEKLGRETGFPLVADCGRLQIRVANRRRAQRSPRSEVALQIYETGL